MTVQSNQHCLSATTDNNGVPTTIINKRAARLWDTFANRYAAKPIADESAYAHKLAITREYLHLESEVLELGCGTGSTALAHAQYVKHIKAIDVSSRMIDIAREKAACANINNIDFEHCDVDCVQFYEKSFDVVLMLNLLHLLADWRQHIATSYQLLKPGGVLVSSTLCINDDFTFIRAPVAVGRIIGLLPKFGFFNRHEFEQAIADVGFQIEYASLPARKAAVFHVLSKPL